MNSVGLFVTKIWIALDLRAIQQIQVSLTFTGVSSGSAIQQQPLLTPTSLLAEAIFIVHCKLHPDLHT